MLRNALSQEVYQFTIHVVRMCPRYAVRPISHHAQAGSLDQLGGPESRCRNRHNPVCIAVNDQRRYVNALEILAEIFMPRRHTSKTRRGGGAGCNVPASPDGLFADALTQEDIRVVEILEKLVEERVTISDNGFLDAIEDSAVHALRVVRRLEQERRNGPDEYRLANTLRPVFPQVACHFTSAHRETDQREIT